jgi:hypothetical protein
MNTGYDTNTITFQTKQALKLQVSAAYFLFSLKKEILSLSTE